MFTAQFHSYCGLAGIPQSFDTLEEARECIARWLRCARRKGYPTVMHEVGRHWEVLEPDGCALVPDGAGEITLSHTEYTCRECGTWHETPEGAATCCAGIFDPFCDAVCLQAFA